jgi:hypothetical protein
MKIFGIKSSSFSDKSDIICVRNLTCPIKGCNAIAHGRTYVFTISHLKKNSCPCLGRFYFVYLKPKWRSINNFGN